MNRREAVWDAALTRLRPYPDDFDDGGPRSPTGRPVSRGGRGNCPTVRCRDSRRIGRRYAVDVASTASSHELLSAPAKGSVGPEPGLSE